MRTPWLLLAVLTLAGCRDHLLDDGDYAFTEGAVLQDDCGLAGTGVLGAGRLRTEGHHVFLSLAKPELTLAGSYQYGAETFFLDGSLARWPATLGGRECLLDTWALHVEATATGDTTLTGTVALTTEAAQSAACVCRAMFEFSGARQ